jgi:hypothetical protein
MNSPVQSRAFVVDIKARPNRLSLGERKAIQARKIEELRKAVCAGGPVSLSEHAELLGLGRSTAWALLNRPYKNSGLTAGVIKRMLASPKLPQGTHAILIQYVEEKANGLYGHSRVQRRRFVAALSDSSDRKTSLNLYSASTLYEARE